MKRLLSPLAVALVVPLLLGGNASGGRSSGPCCEIVQLAKAGALPAGFSPSLAVSIARPPGYESGTGSSFTTSNARGRVTYSVGLSAAPLDGLRSAALSAIRRPAKLVLDGPVDVRHEAVLRSAATALSSLSGVGTLDAYEVAAAGPRRGTFIGALSFPLASASGNVPVVTVRVDSGFPCCNALAVQALTQTLAGVALEGNLPVASIDTQLRSAREGFTLSGSVRDGFGAPLVGESVSLIAGSAQATTDAFGAFSLSLPKTMASGTYTLKVADAGACCTATRSVQLNFGKLSPPSTAVNLLDPNRRWVVAHPHIYNIFWDNKWASHNPWSRHQIDVATSQIVNSGFFSKLTQYGITSPAWEGSHDSAAAPECSVIWGPRAPTTLSSLTLFKWISCVASHLPTDSRFPVSNDLYVVYLPVRTTVVDGPSIGSFSILGISFPGLTLPLFKSCQDYGGYHFFGLSTRGPFAYVVLPASCATEADVPFESLTGTASHELVEAMTDPVLTQGWIDDSFSGVHLFKDAEAEDLCAPQTGSQPGTVALIPNSQVALDPYWSNTDGKCVN